MQVIVTKDRFLKEFISKVYHLPDVGCTHTKSNSRSHKVFMDQSEVLAMGKTLCKFCEHKRRRIRSQEKMYELLKTTDFTEILNALPSNYEIKIFAHNPNYKSPLCVWRRSGNAL